MFRISKGVVTSTANPNPPGEGKPQTVVSAVPIKFVAVEYFDGAGRRTQDVFLEVGGSYFAPPNSAEWANSLREASRWVSEGIKGKLVQDVVKVADTVDIVPLPEA